MNSTNQLLNQFKKDNITSFKDNIWGADSADMQLISKYNKGIMYLLCAFDQFSKYAWVVYLKNKKDPTNFHAFPKNFTQFEKKTKQNVGWSRQWIL